MKVRTIVVVATLLAAGAAGLAPQQPSGYTTRSDDSKLIAQLPRTKHTLLQGIEQVSKTPEVAISAKFELEDKGDLSLSVYTAGKGLGVNAEENVLKELSGDPTSEKWTPETEVFKDVEHVARSAEQLTIVALSKLSLAEIIKKAAKDRPGTVYSATPMLRDHKAVFVVLIAGKEKPVELVYDAITGESVGAK